MSVYSVALDKFNYLGLFLYPSTGVVNTYREEDFPLPSWIRLELHKLFKNWHSICMQKHQTLNLTLLKMEIAHNIRYIFCQNIFKIQYEVFHADETFVCK